MRPLLRPKVRAALRLISVALIIAHAYWIVKRHFNRLDRDQKRTQVQRWSARFARALGVTVLARGELGCGGVMLVCNHVSWLDIVVISGAIFFHVFTPLGIAVRNNDGSSDGGELFLLACGVWLARAALLWLRGEVWLVWIRRIKPG